MSTRDAATALRRFGLGARPGELRRIAEDPRGYLLQTLAQRDGAVISGTALAPSHVTLASLMVARLERRAAGANAKDAASGNAAKNMPVPEPPGGDTGKADRKVPSSDPASPRPQPAQIRRQAFVEEAAARFGRATTTDAAFLERLVMFWSNHFCVSANKGQVASIAGAYEREAIRPHVLGRFADMLLAVERHPAMLIYLDNAQSIGPNSRAGLNRGRGLNENLAREILELHTLGVNGGYTQEDVTNLARILTGWTVANLAAPMSGEPGRFLFAPARHEPGEWAVLGKTYLAYGARAGEDVLHDLAMHPSTARRVASKLARHFVSDSAPAALVEQLERTFLATSGDLRAITETLVKAPQVWEAAPAKVLPPYDFLVAVMRAIGFQPRAQELLRLTNLLGQPLWRPPSPAGWSDADDAWAAPSALRERLRVAEVAARQGGAGRDPREVAEDILGDQLGAATRQAVARAEAREQGLELLIMSPEFLRR